MFGMFTTPAEGHAARCPEGAWDGPGCGIAASRASLTVCRLARSVHLRPRARARDVLDPMARSSARGGRRPCRPAPAAATSLHDSPAFRMHPESSPATRSVPHEQELPRRLPQHSDGRPSSFHPFDKCRRNFVSNDHDAQDPIVPEQCRDAQPRRGDGWISCPCLGDAARRSASHCGYQFEHDARGEIPTCLPLGPSPPRRARRHVPSSGGRLLSPAPLDRQVVLPALQPCGPSHRDAHR